LQKSLPISKESPEGEVFKFSITLTIKLSETVIGWSSLHGFLLVLCLKAITLKPVIDKNFWLSFVQSKASKFLRGQPKCSGLEHGSAKPIKTSEVVDS
jgi:hypothetical protein